MLNWLKCRFPYPMLQLSQRQTEQRKMFESRCHLLHLGFYSITHLTNGQCHFARYQIGWHHDRRQPDHY